MTAEVIQIRDYQNPKDLAPMHGEGAEEKPRVQPFGVDYSAAEPYHAPDQDPA